ncbi:pilus assembly protein [Sphingopyxis indica]|uniref:TadE/TadG family type IV pilus assembly protein n=1 Tax=Sphingopyxis indica TaxID=436663 RepID=UPI002938D97D|nr:TadE/TadG family type IV pilus assembly protein [Sphingopyxis indica]WOF43067.1 pilus assembly protein [Sphingopyxis indica]
MRRVPRKSVADHELPSPPDAPDGGILGVLSAVGRSARGSAALEFAIVAPAFIALLLGALQIGLIYLVQTGLETAVQSSARLIMTGVAQTMSPAGNSTGQSGMSAADFKDAVCIGISGSDVNGKPLTVPRALPPFLSCSRVAINVAVMPVGCTSPNLSAPTYAYSNGVLISTGGGYGSSDCAGTSHANDGLVGTQGRLVIVQLSYLLPALAAPLGFNFITSPNGERLVVATYVVTVENYGCATGVQVC